MKTYTCTTKEYAALEAAMRRAEGLPHYGRDCVGTGPRSRAWLAAHLDDAVTTGFAGQPATEFPIPPDLEAKIAADRELSLAEKSALTTACAEATEKPQKPITSVVEEPVAKVIK